MTLVILDTETVGLPGKEERVCEMALLENSLGSWQAHSELINPQVAMTPDAMAVHHITPEMIVDAPVLSESEVYQKLQALNHEKAVLIIQNAPFDLGVLANYNFVWKGEVIDTLRCAKQLLETPRHGLQYLRYALELYKEEQHFAKTFGISVEAHRALSDVIVTKLLFDQLLEEVGRLPQALVVVSNRPVLLKTIGFGKYKGRSYEEMVAQDSDYFAWCLREFQKLAPDARATIEYWMQAS